MLRDVSARGARIRFVEAGVGPAVVFLHDALATHATFTAALGPLAEAVRQGFRLIALDLPGFGASEKPDPRRYTYGWDAFADSVADLIAALGLGRVHVCGHGMGGGIALAVTARHPALVDKLILVDALVYAPEREHWLDRAGRTPVLGGVLFSQMMGRRTFRAYLEGTVYAGGARPSNERAEAYFAAFDDPAARMAAHASVLAKADTRSLVARLPRVNADSLIVWGRHDGVAPIEQGRRLSRALKGRFEVMECGRCAPDEQPDAFASVLANFLRAGGARMPAGQPRAAT